MPTYQELHIMMNDLRRLQHYNAFCATDYLDFSNVDNPDDIDTMYMSPIVCTDIQKKQEILQPPPVQGGFLFPITLHQNRCPNVDRPIDVDALVAERDECVKNYQYQQNTNFLARNEPCPRCGSHLVTECASGSNAIIIVVNDTYTYLMKECCECQQRWHNVRLPNGGTKLPVKREDGAYVYDKMKPDPNKWVSTIIYDGVIPAIQPLPQKKTEQGKRPPSRCVVS